MKISKKLFVLPFLVFSMSSCGKTPEKETKTFTVTWKNHDGTVLEVDKKVKEGTMPHFDGTTPEKAMTDSQVFNFKGWSPKLVKVTKNATYTAQFDEEARKYEVKWLDDDAETFCERLSARVLAYGVAGELCNLEMLYDDATIWETRFKNALLFSSRKKGELILKQRGWF